MLTYDSRAIMQAAHVSGPGLTMRHWISTRVCPPHIRIRAGRASVDLADHINSVFGCTRPHPRFIRTTSRWRQHRHELPGHYDSEQRVLLGQVRSKTGSLL